MPQTALDKSYDFFIDTNLNSYKGEWIAIVDSQIVSHGKDLKKVVQEAREKHGNEKFLLAKVPSSETMIF